MQANLLCERGRNVKKIAAVVLFVTIVAVFICGCGTFFTNKDDSKGEAGDSELQVDGEDGGDADTEEEIVVEWTESPTLDMIPHGPVRGMANGYEFTANTVFFEPRFGNWRLVLAENLLSSPLSPVPGGQSVNIDLPEEPEPGSVFIKEMAYGNGYFQINKKGSEGTTSWNADNAYAVEITEWDVKGFDRELGAFQVAGKASGRVFVVYSGEDWEDFDNSWAAGSFTDVNVRYMGEPE